MVFSSLTFLFIFLPVVLCLVYISPKHYRNFILLIASLFFYGFKEPTYLLLMLLSITINYISAKYIEQKRKYAKQLLWTTVAINLLFLFFFKYFNFTLSLASLDALLIDVVLPVGISFYTFQTLSYVIDVYHQKVKASQHFINFATYVTFFPQLVAGPIVRYEDIAQQLQFRKESIERFSYGIQRLMLGLIKKVLFANEIGQVHQEILSLSSRSVLTAWLGVIAFAFQIYFDFSGYSDMAIGLGEMFGFSLMENFNYPYIAKSVSDFFRRWHISLADFFKQYVYIPLGGNRYHVIQNIMIVWLLTGLWHGASLNFILWGIYFGVWIILEKTLFKQLQFMSILNHLIVLWIVLMGWVIFSIEDFDKMLLYFKDLYFLNKNSLMDTLSLFYVRNYIVLWIVLIVSSTPILSIFKQRKANVWVLVCLYIGFFYAIANLVSSSYNPFLYFRF